jgi:glucose/arabinose dehydrogenase
MTFYYGNLFPEWQGDLFIATMSPLFGRKVIRLSLRETPQGMRVAGEEFINLTSDPEGLRVRDVKQGPDGALYVVSDIRGNVPTGPDRIFRLVPKK